MNVIGTSFLETAICVGVRFHQLREHGSILCVV